MDFNKLVCRFLEKKSKIFLTLKKIAVNTFNFIQIFDINLKRQQKIVSSIYSYYISFSMPVKKLLYPKEIPKNKTRITKSIIISQNVISL